MAERYYKEGYGGMVLIVSSLELSDSENATLDQLSLFLLIIRI
jgi:hypothetical protein